jgi:hypothetical protein
MRLVQTFYMKWERDTNPRLSIAFSRRRYHFRAASECLLLISRYRWQGRVQLGKLSPGGSLLFSRSPPLADAFLHVGADGNVEQALDHRGRYEVTVIVSYER